jgi:hypothetical protein
LAQTGSDWSCIFLGAPDERKTKLSSGSLPGGWQILVTRPDARAEQLSGYSSEAEAVKWINNLSDKWADKHGLGGGAVGPDARQSR